MSDKKKNKMVLVKINDVDDAELDATIDKALDVLFGEDKPIEVSRQKDTKSSPKKKETLTARKKSK